MLERLIRYLMLALGAAALGISLLYWIVAIRKVAPPNVPLVTVARQNASDPAANAASLFGDSSQTPDLALELAGVLSFGKAHGAAAVIKIDDAAPIVVAQGKDIMPGMILKTVKASSIIVTRNGIDREVFLATRDTATPPSVYVR